MSLTSKALALRAKQQELEVDGENEPRLPAGPLFPVGARKVGQTYFSAGDKMRVYHNFSSFFFNISDGPLYFTLSCRPILCGLFLFCGFCGGRYATVSLDATTFHLHKTEQKILHELEFFVFVSVV